MHLLEFGIFTNKLKIAKVIPTFKSENKSLPNNYKTILLLPTLSKVLKNLIKVELIKFLNKSKTIQLFQNYMVFEIKSAPPMLYLTLLLLVSMQYSNKNIGVFFHGHEKALDMVCHKRLLYKVQHFGVR